jgi:hypothetical protein
LRGSKSKRVIVFLFKDGCDNQEDNPIPAYSSGGYENRSCPALKTGMAQIADM